MRKIAITLVIFSLLGGATAYLGFAHGPPSESPVSCKESKVGTAKLTIERPGDLLNLDVLLANGCPEALTNHYHDVDPK